MHTEQWNEWIAYADAAYENRQYAAALEWLQKALEEEPDDLYVLSRAGAISVSLNRFDDALRYFRHAVEVDSGNGENLFNLANAYFFKQDYGMALKLYVQALKADCPPAVEGKIYFQMGIICSMRQDPVNALVNFRKYEATDPSGMLSLEPELISEKLKMYLLQENYEMAAACAAQLVAVSPSVYPYYSVSFGLYMAAQDYASAEKMLNDAQAYAVLSRKDRLQLGMQKAAFYQTLADKNPEQKDAYLDRSQAVLSEIRGWGIMTPADEKEWILSVADISMKRGNHDQVIALLERILYPETAFAGVDEEVVSIDDDEAPLSDAEIEEILRNDMIMMEQRIARGELDEQKILESGEVTYDELGNQVVTFGAQAFGEDAVEEILPEDDTESEESAADDESFRERALFKLLSCCAEKEYYEKTVRYAAELKISENAYYKYFGRYCEAFASKKLFEAGVTGENADQLYAETIAFFRSKMMENSADKYPIVFRARMYAETGKFVKAEEMLKLLSEADAEAVGAYIEQCRAESNQENG